MTSRKRRLQLRRKRHAAEVRQREGVLGRNILSSLWNCWRDVEIRPVDALVEVWASPRFLVAESFLMHLAHPTREGS